MNEWEIEPNKLNFIECGIRCEIIRSPFGFFNAYIYIPEYNIFHGIDELQLNQILRPSTEITYSEYSDSYWKVGISFSSINDFIPNISYENDPDFIVQMREMLGFEPATPDSYKNIEYAINELKSLVQKILINKN